MRHKNLAFRGWGIRHLVLAVMITGMFPGASQTSPGYMPMPPPIVAPPVNSGANLVIQNINPRVHGIDDEDSESESYEDEDPPPRTRRSPKYFTPEGRPKRQPQHDVEEETSEEPESRAKPKKERVRPFREPRSQQDKASPRKQQSTAQRRLEYTRRMVGNLKLVSNYALKLLKADPQGLSAADVATAEADIAKFRSQVEADLAAINTALKESLGSGDESKIDALLGTSRDNVIRAFQALKGRGAEKILNQLVRDNYFDVIRDLATDKTARSAGLVDPGDPPMVPDPRKLLGRGLLGAIPGGTGTGAAGTAGTGTGAAGTGTGAAGTGAGAGSTTGSSSFGIPPSAAPGAPVTTPQSPSPGAPAAAGSSTPNESSQKLDDMETALGALELVTKHAKEKIRDGSKSVARKQPAVRDASKLVGSVHETLVALEASAATDNFSKMAAAMQSAGQKMGTALAEVKKGPAGDVMADYIGPKFGDMISDLGS